MLYETSEQALAIQVSYSLGDEFGDTYKRELTALEKLSQRNSFDKLLVITYEEKKTVSVGGRKIEIVPVWECVIST